MPEIRNNRLLAALPEAEWQVWRPRLELVELDLGEVLHEAKRVPRCVYFPTTAVVSLLYISDNGDCDEVAVVGHEGIVGLSLFMDGESTPASAVVQSPGHAWRVPAWKVAGDFERSPVVMHVLLRYALALGAQIAQTSVCNRRHTVSQRLCRRLLQALDRQPGRELVTTQEQLATLLGVRRESVSAEAQKLQKAGCVHYSRGHIIVLDRAGLERHACGCHAAVEREYHRLLPVPVPAIEVEPPPTPRGGDAVSAFRRAPERTARRAEPVC